MASGADIILDVGAHIGVFSIMASAKNAGGKIFALECDQENYALLQMNVEINQAHNIYPFHLAMADRNGSVNLYASDENWGHSICSEGQGRTSAPYGPYRRVGAVTLERFVKSQGLERIDYVKMNVEGAEYGILLNCPAKILRLSKRLLVEFHPNPIHDGQRLADWLRDCGFNTKCKLADNDPRKGWLTAELQP